MNSSFPTCASDLLNCPICLGFLSASKTVIAINCGHVFHQECLKYAFKNRKKKCPTCRGKVTSKQKLFFSTTRFDCKHKDQLEKLRDENEQLKKALQNPLKKTKYFGPPPLPPRRRTQAAVEKEDVVTFTQRTDIFRRIFRRIASSFKQS